MAKYILVYGIAGDPELGGGTFTEEFGMEEQQLHQRVQDLVTEHKDSVTVIHAGFLQVEFTYEAIQYAVRVEPKRV